MAERCNGELSPGPNKSYYRCRRCGTVHYELYAGDRCDMLRGEPFPDPAEGRPPRPLPERRRCRYPYKGRRIR